MSMDSPPPGWEPPRVSGRAFAWTLAILLIIVVVLILGA
jgi:hypothetical protein